MCSSCASLRNTCSGPTPSSLVPSVQRPSCCHVDGGGAGMQVSSDLSVGSVCRLARKDAACAYCECEHGGEAVGEEGVHLPLMVAMCGGSTNMK